MKTTKEVKKTIVEMRIINLDKINPATCGIEKIKSLHKECKGFDSVKEIRKWRQRRIIK